VPQDRITDHRIGLTVHNLPGVLMGDLDPLLEGWAHRDEARGVVGIVASRLVERFGRPAIVVTVGDEDVAKGSGRSVPGVDLHSLVASASGRLTRWGGHAGAIGLQLARADVAGFRSELATAADGIAAALARARVREVDVVVGAADLSLEVAEAIDAMQPFGTSNSEVRMAMPGAVIEQVGTVGRDAQHLQMRLRAGGAIARALAWRQGPRHASFTPGERGDAIVQLGIERWQDMVGPRVTLDTLDRPTAVPAVRVQCETPCDRTCDARFRWSAPAVLDDDPPPAGPGVPTARPRGIRDHRDSGRAISTIAQLCGADRGVVAVVADTARRRGIVDTILRPASLGVEVAVLGGERCDTAEMAARMAAVGDAPVLGLVDHGALAGLAIGQDVHLVLVDPPATGAAMRWLAWHAADRWVHVVWGEDERRFTREVVAERADLRPVAAEIWRGIAHGDPVPWGPDLDLLLSGGGGAVRPPGIVRDALRALREIGRIEIDEEGIRARTDAAPARLEDAPTSAAAAARATDDLAIVDRADDLGFLSARYPQ